MLEKILTPLVLVYTMGEINGKTRFQKLMFLIQINAPRKSLSKLDYGFMLHYYGPFSTELSSIIDNMVHRNYLQEDVEATSSEYLRYTYRLTSEGRAIVEEVIQKEVIPFSLIKIIRKIAANYGNLPLELLVRKAYEQFGPEKGSLLTP